MSRNIRTFARRGVVALAAAGAVLATTGPVGAQPAGGPPPGPRASDARTPGGGTAQEGERRQIASSTLGRDYRFTLTALRSTSDPFAASVRLKVFTFRDGAWRESDRATVGEVDGWFWFPLTGRGAICQFSTASTEPAPIAVSLLVTPSIGCSPPERFEVSDGRIRTA